MKNPYTLWINQVSESDGTSKRYMTDIQHFAAWSLESYGINVQRLPVRWRQAKYKGEAERERFLDELKDIVKDYFAQLKREYAPLSVNRGMSVIMSFLHNFDIPIKPMRLRHPYVIYHNRDITKEEMRLILEHSDVRNRAIDLMLYESGMRPDTLANLRFKHIKGEFLANRIPMKIDLTEDILKCRVSERWTFIGEEGFEALKKYLVTRLPLKDEDYVFVSEKPPGRKLKSNALSQAFNKMVQKLRLAISQGKGKPKPLRLYCLKKAFRKFMLVEEAYKEFWMGRSGNEAPAITGASIHYISRDVEYHRQLYAQGYEGLRLHPPSSGLQTMVNKLTAQNQDLRERLERLENTDPLLTDIKEICQLPGAREFFTGIVTDTKTKLAEMLQKQKGLLDQKSAEGETAVPHG